MQTSETTSTFISAPDGLKLHARSHGRRSAPGLPVVCLPGLARTAADFDALADSLASSITHPRRVVALDYRGRGALRIRPRSGQLLLSHRTRRRAGGGHRARLPAGDFRRHLARRHSHHAARRRAADRNRRRGAQRYRSGDRAEGPDAHQGLCRQAAAAAQLRGSRRDPAPAVRRAIPQADARRLAGQRTPHLQGGERPARCRPTTSSSPRPWRASISSIRCRRSGRNSTRCARCRSWSIRGENSDLLSAATVDAMRARRAALETLNVPDQGHAPLLAEADVIERIADFVARCEN